MATWAEVHAYADLFGARLNKDVRTYTPMRAIPVVHLAGSHGVRLATPMIWGFTDRKPIGRRMPKHMHARGETVHRLATFTDAFRYRRGLAFAKTFNEGKEISVIDSAGDPTGKTWTQQWVIRPKNDKPIIMGFIFDRFSSSDHQLPEYECVQVTTPANAIIARITDRMPLILREADIPLWLGEENPSLDDVRGLIQTMEFTSDEWEITIEDPTKTPPVPRGKKPKAPSQFDLF